MASFIRAHRLSSVAGLSGPQRYAFTGYRWLLLGILLAGCAQIFLAGLGVFSFGDHDAAGGTSAFDVHRTFGFTLAGVAVIISVLAVILRPGVMPVVQTTLLMGLASNSALYGGRHARDGLLVPGIAGFLCASARRRQS